MELGLFSITIVILLYILGASVFRKPFSSTKFTFSLFAFLLIVWNISEIIHTFLPVPWYNFGLHRSLFSYLTLYSLILYALHFPQYNRRENRLSYFTVFLGGIGYMVILHTISIPFVEEKFPLEARFFTKTNAFLSRSFMVLCIICLFVITFYKLINSIQRLRKILVHAMIAVFALVLAIALLNSYIPDTMFIPLNSPELFVLDGLFVILFGLVVIQFKFISFYPGVLSLFLYGEIPKLMIQRMAPATARGIAYLKNELWKIYELENWNNYISEFWFSLIIDETLDNALEHGGKRVDDEVTIQVFECNQFIDFYVVDMGKGFDPDKVPDPSKPDRKVVPTGRGLYILRKLFEIDWNFLGNEVRVRVSKKKPNNPELE
jgi:hypothetical protein